MTKKHFLTCRVMLVLVFISGLNAHSRNITVKAIRPARLSRNTPEYIFLKTTSIVYNFADEDLPVNDARITRKLKKSLMQHDFKNIQSTILHRKAEKLFPIIEPILKFYGIPDDFKYIPLVGKSTHASGES